ncbi:MAG: uroporphyrinogen-III synthase [Alphaproteobacteria bacterium]|nr:uroporphyrinogen-III synthase [Alphaproteobacteria bacterium]
MRILLARPREDAERLAPKLVARGHEVLIEPLINIVPVPGVAIDLEGVQAVLFTSANGVRAFAGASPRRDLTVLAVGEATAEAARLAGFTSVESAGGDVNDLARLVRARLDPAGGALLHAAGSAVAGDLAGSLEAAGFSIRRAVLYGAWPVDKLSAPAAAVLAAKAVDLVVLFSPRSAETFVKLVQSAGLAESVGRVVMLGLSPAVATAAAGLHWAERLAADKPEEPALLNAIDRLAQQRAHAATPAPAPAAPQVVVKRRGGALAFLALLVALGGVGWAGWLDWRARTAPPPILDPAPRLAAIEQRLAATAELRAANEALSARAAAADQQIQGLASALASARAPAQAAAQAAAAAQNLAGALGGRVERLERAVAALPAPPADPAPRLAAIEQRLGALTAAAGQAPSLPAEWAGRIEALERRVAIAAAAPAAAAQGPAASGDAPAADDAVPDQRVVAVERALSSLDATLARMAGALAALERRIAALEAAPAPGADPGQVAALRAETERLAGDLARATRSVQESAGPTGPLAQRLAFTQLRDAIGRGDPFAGELVALRASGAAAAVEALAPIAGAAERGIATRAALAQRFPAVADAVARIGRPAEAPWWWTPIDRLRGLVQIRPVGDVPGDSAAALVARAEQRLTAGDLPGALAILDGLSGPSAEAASRWRAEAAQRVQAEALLAQIGAQFAGAGAPR